MKTFVVGVVLVAVVVASGCSRGGELASGDPVAGVDLVPGPVGSFDVITHGDDGPFWSVFQQGVAQAGIDLGTTVRYQGAAGDLVAQAEMVLAAVEQGSGGVAMSVPDPAALEEAAGAVTTARLPFYVVNVGEDEADDLGAVTYIGPSDYETGQAAGARFDGLGATSVLCARQDENVDFDQRCQGLEASFSGTVISEFVGSDPAEQERIMSTIMGSNPEIDAVFGTDAGVTARAVVAARSADADVMIGGVGLSDELVAAVEVGDVAFTLDSDPYLQGYLAVVLMFQQAGNLSAVGAGLPVITGPGLVTAENVEQVAALMADGTR